MHFSLTMLSWTLAVSAILVAALLDRLNRARRLERQRAFDDLAALSWQQFEEVIADAFRRHGFRVLETGGRGTADGGVDLVLVRDGQRTVVHSRRPSGRSLTPAAAVAPIVGEPTKRGVAMSSA